MADRLKCDDLDKGADPIRDKAPKSTREDTPDLETCHVQIEHIQLSGSTQMRTTIDAGVLNQYQADMEEGAQFPPVRLVQEGLKYWLADGHYRVEASRQLGRSEIEALVSQGTERDAILLACGANREHGIRRTGADVRKAIEFLVNDSTWGKKSDNWIAETVGCDHKTVAKLKRHLGIPECTVRQTSDGRTMDVSRIGKSNSSKGQPQGSQEEAKKAEGGSANSQQPPWKRFDGSVADDVEQIKCPHCGEALPAEWLRKLLDGGTQ